MAAAIENPVQGDVGSEPLPGVAVPGSVATEYLVRGVVRSAGDGKIVLNPVGTSYELHLRLEGDSAMATGAVVRGTIHVKGRKVWTVSAGGSFVAPITGEPRVIQGRVKYAQATRLVVQAGASVVVELPQEPSAYDLVNGPMGVGSLVNITLYPGAEFKENTMLNVMQRSPGPVLTWVVGVLIAMQGGVICAQEPVRVPVVDATPDAAVDKPASPAKKPAKMPTTRATSTRAAKAGVPADDGVKPAQKFRFTRTSKLDPKSPLGLAVEEIRREYGGGVLRNDSSYFRDAPCNDLTTDTLFILLDRNLGATAALDAYIKWQLLSSLPTTLAAQYKPLVIAALNKAPLPNMTPGVIADDAQRQQMEREVARFDGEQAKATMEKLDSERNRFQTLNKPILAYRSALAGLLEESYDGSMAAFADAYHRAQAGAEYATALDRAARLANGWLKTNPPNDMLQRFADALAEIRGMKLNDVVAQFDPNEQRGGFDLRRDQRNMDAGGRILALERDLKERLGTAQDDVQNNRPSGRRRGR